MGEDQKQHLELARNIAQRVNQRFGEVFRLPEPFIPPKSAGGRIMSLTDPGKKMAKSEQSDPKSYIALLDSPDEIVKKVRAAGAGAENGLTVTLDCAILYASERTIKGPHNISIGSVHSREDA